MTKFFLSLALVLTVTWAAAAPPSQAPATDESPQPAHLKRTPHERTASQFGRTSGVRDFLQPIPPAPPVPPVAPRTDDESAVDEIMKIRSSAGVSALGSAQERAEFRKALARVAAEYRNGANAPETTDSDPTVAASEGGLDIGGTELPVQAELPNPPPLSLTEPLSSPPTGSTGSLATMSELAQSLAHSGKLLELQAEELEQVRRYAHADRLRRLAKRIRREARLVQESLPRFEAE